MARRLRRHLLGDSDRDPIGLPRGHKVGLGPGPDPHRLKGFVVGAPRARVHMVDPSRAERGVLVPVDIVPRNDGPPLEVQAGHAGATVGMDAERRRHASWREKQGEAN